MPAPRFVHLLYGRRQLRGSSPFTWIGESGGCACFPASLGESRRRAPGGRLEPDILDGSRGTMVSWVSAIIPPDSVKAFKPFSRHIECRRTRSAAGSPRGRRRPRDDGSRGAVRRPAASPPRRLRDGAPTHSTKG